MSVSTVEKGVAVDGGGGCQFQSQLRTFTSCNKPAWLVSTLADLEQKIRTLVLNSEDDEHPKQADTFAQRAQFYYQQRPQLLSLLQELYDTYLLLADRYCQSLHKHHHRNLGAAASSEHLSFTEDYQSDAESSLSYQLPLGQAQAISQFNQFDEIIAELVIKNVEYDLMVHELGIKEKRAHESARKIELQRSLLEVLESERLILLNENAGLRYKVKALVEENRGLASESMFMKRKAGELARCVLKMRDDHRVCMMSRKIEDLQGKIFGLEKRNQEYYLELVKRGNSQCPSCKGGGSTSGDEVEGVNTEACFQGSKERGHNKGSKISRWWDKVKKSDLLFLCKPNPSKSLV